MKTFVFDPITNVFRRITNVFDSITNVFDLKTNVFDSLTNVFNRNTNIFDSKTYVFRPIANAFEMKTKGLKKKRRLSPQEKKLLSYKKDCRNMVAESGSKSRFAIAKRKAYAHQAFRHAQKQILGQLNETSEDASEIIEIKVESVKKDGWRKISDSPLGELVSVQSKVRQRIGMNEESKESELLKEVEKEDFRRWRRYRWSIYGR